MHWKKFLPADWIDWTLLVVCIPLLLWDVFSKNDYSGASSALIFILIGIQAYKRPKSAEEKKELQMIGTGILVVASLFLAIMLFTKS